MIAVSRSSLPQWTIAIDQPSSTVYAQARRSLLLTLVSVGGALLFVAAILAYVVLRSRRETDIQASLAHSWARLTRALAIAATPGEVADAALESLRSAIPDAVPVVAVDSEAGDEIRTASLPRSRDLDLVVAEIARLGRGERASRSLEDEPTLRALYVDSGRRLRDAHSVPIPGPPGEPPVGSITLLTSRHRLAPTEWELLAGFADQAVGALGRARIAEHEHELARRLQQSLLPDRLPGLPGVRLEGEYLAGSDDVEVGGDWYDAVVRADGFIQLCVGDVSGKGVAAATIMGRQRSVFRAYAYDCVSPADLMRRMLRHVNDEEMITAACVSIDPLAGELTYACAGHPPPLLVDRESGEIQRLDAASSPPFGVATPDDVVEARVVLPQQARLALYTDGLVERRGENIEDGITLLGKLLSEHPGITSDEVLRAVGTEIGAPMDDVALLLAVLDATVTFSVELPADPGGLPELRRRLRAWLARIGTAGDESADVVVAVSEACNNAIEHAYGAGGGTFRLSLSVDEELLRIEVSDQGAWREPVANDERGRGILLMESLMHEVEIDRTERGTNVTLKRRRGVPVPTEPATLTGA